MSAQPRDSFSGLWWVAHGGGAPLQLRLYPDGTAWSDYPDNNPGQWSVVDGDKAVCRWADDWKEVLFLSDDGWKKWGYKPKASLQGPPSNTSRAYRVCSSPDGWFGPGR